MIQKCLSDSTYRKYTIVLMTSKRKGLQHFRVIMICLSLGLWQNVTQGKGEYGVFQNKALVDTEAPSVRGSDVDSLSVLFETLYPKHLSQKLSKICTLHLFCSLCHQLLRAIAFTSVHSVTLCTLLYMSFSLSFHISQEPKTIKQ